MTEQDTQSAATSNPMDAIMERLNALKTEVQQQLKDPTKAQKALETLTKKSALPLGDALDKPLRDLQKASLEAVGLEEERKGLLKEIEVYLERQKMKTRMQFLGDLQAFAREQDVEVVKLSDTPLTVHLAPLTVEVDFDKGKATLLYAREVVDEVRLTPRAVLEGRKLGAAKIKDRSVESPLFFDLLHQAYQFLLLSRGEPAGNRVDLVDLLVPLAVLSADQDKLRKNGIDAIKEYPRYLLAYQLNRLRRDGILEKDGRRIDLGTATGGSTKNKKDVLFIPSTGTEGQYYLSIRIGF